MLRIAIFCLTPFALLAQDASLTLAGTVVDSQTGAPVAHALVSIQGFPRPKDSSSATSPQMFSRSALTDASGVFQFSALPSGNYFVYAQKPGYEFGSPATSGLRTGMVDLQSSVEDMRVALSAAGAITGKVVDDHDDPMRGVGIHAVSLPVVDGLKEIRSIRTVTTDDRGQYRIADLPPGEYFLKATGQGGPNLLSATPTARLDVGDSFAPVYFGGSSTVNSASPVEIGSGTHATADFRLKIEPAWRILATLRNFNPREKVNFTLVIDGEEISAGPDRFNSETGAMEFKDVVPGSYILRAMQGNMTGEVAVTVAGSDTENAVLALYPPVDIPVTVRFTNPAASAAPALAILQSDDGDGDAAPPPECAVSLDAPQMNGAVGPAKRVVARDGVLPNVLAGSQRISIQCFDGYVRSALEGTQDLLADPVITILPGASPPPMEILATHGGGALTAKLDSGILTGPASLQVLLVPQFSGTAGPLHQEGNFGARGPANPFTFVFGNLAPGTYAVYAFANQNAEYRNPDFLKSLSGGQIVQIDEGARKEITIDKVMP